MKPVPRKPREEEDSISELKKQNEAVVEETKEEQQPAEPVKKENGI